MPDRLVLASASPRREELLRSAGFTFVILPADVDETAPHGTATGDQALVIARRKAAAASGKLRARDWDGPRGDVILAADTVVLVGNTVLGKPRNPVDAERMLRLLSGKTHHVVTGFAVTRTDGASERAATVVSEVEFRSLSDDEIAGYVGTKDPLDKAGAYAIQGGAAGFVRKIHGSYTNVVGLPLVEVIEAIAEISDAKPYGHG